MARRFASLPVVAPTRQASRSGPASAPRRPTSDRVPVMPDHVRRRISRDADGCESCLRYFSGGMEQSLLADLYLLLPVQAPH